MFEILVVIAFVWLMFKAIGLMWKLTWGMAKIVAGFLVVLALPLLIVCMIFAGGVVLLAPLVLLAVAIGIVAR